MQLYRSKFSLALLTSSVVAFCLSGSVFAKETTDIVDEKVKQSQHLPLSELRTFAEVMDQIKTAYVEPIDDKTLLENAIKGMLAGLDPHSAYLEPRAFEDLQIHTTGKFGGLGIEVTLDDGYVKIITPIDNSPAEAAGLEAGDLIVEIDGQNVQGMSISEAVGLMRGKIGSKIELSIYREGEDKPFEVTLVRDTIEVTSVRKRDLGDGYGYIRISQFQVNTGKELEKAINALSEENNLKGLVLDLRNNPGGVLHAAVDVSDAFINEGLIVYTEGRLANAEIQYKATPDTLLNSTPLVVLVNGGSASASEIVAGALQDQKRAVIMGTNTFGKGSVQTVLPLNNNRGLKLTTARYYTPGGRSIQAQGIEPDIVVERAHLQKDPKRKVFKESNLARHLQNENKPNEKKESNKKTKDLSDTDYQLYEALNLLKGLNIAALQNKIQEPLKQSVE